MDFLESDMYEPVAKFLEKEGYEVKGEVKNCDMVACKDGTTVIVELKKTFGLKLVYQAVDRQEFSDYVYVAIGRNKKGMKDSSFKSMAKLLKRLDIGLITVAMDSPLKIVQEVITPIDLRKVKNKAKRAALDSEFENRNLGGNKGGVSREKIITAYREKSIKVLCILEKRKVITTKEIREMGETEANSILYKNYYGWFERLEKGVYKLSPKGESALEIIEFKDVIEYYRKTI